MSICCEDSSGACKTEGAKDRMGLGGKKQGGNLGTYGRNWAASGNDKQRNVPEGAGNGRETREEKGQGERERGKERKSSANKGRLRVKAEAEQNKKAAGEMKRDRYMDAEAADMEIAELRDLEEGKSEKIEK